MDITDNAVLASLETKILRFLVSDNAMVYRFAEIIEEDYFNSYANKLSFRYIKTILFTNITMSKDNIVRLMFDDKEERNLPQKHLTNIFKEKYIEPKEVSEYLTTIRNEYKRKKSIEFSEELNQAGEKNCPFSEIEKIMNKYSFLREETSTEAPEQLISLIRKNKQKLIESIETGQSIEDYIPFPFDNLNSHIKIRQGNLIIIGARPAMGKSSFALQSALRLSKMGERVYFANLEMSKTEMKERIFSMVTKIPLADFNSLTAIEQLEKINLIEAEVEKLALDFEMDDNVFTIESIISRIKSLHKEKKLSVVFIDYLQLISSTNGKKNASTSDDIGYISRALKVLASELKITIVALSQLNRGVEQRENKRPLLSDLRSSGNIEQDANIVLFLYNDEYYYGSKSVLKGITEIIIAKNRSGATGTEFLKWFPNITFFKEVKDEEFERIQGK